MQDAGCTCASSAIGGCTQQMQQQTVATLIAALVYCLATKAVIIHYKSLQEPVARFQSHYKAEE